MKKPTRIFRGHPLSVDEPLKHSDHLRPKTRREFISSGFRSGGGMLLGSSIISMMGSQSHAISDGLLDKYYQPTSCDLANLSGRKIPFICFDLAGGANISGSNVLVGGPGGQRDPLSTAGYDKLGIKPDSVPFANNPNSASGDFSDDSLGLLFHSESAMLRGIKERASGTAQLATNGAIIPGRSDNDTGNNPHNPMYGIYQSGLRGQLLQLVGSENSVSGGNSMAPSLMINPEIRPTKIDRPADARGLVDVGDLNSLLENPEDVLAVMETMKHITDFKLDMSDTLVQPGSSDQSLKNRLACEYIRSADTLEKYSSPADIDPSEDPIIVGSNGIFSQSEFDGDREFQKTASVMKLVIEGHAGAGTIEMGGYDYHTGDRRTGEARDLRAGRCIGACIEYAFQKQTPLMLYVFSDGSVASDGTIEMVNGIEKGVWTGDNSSTAASFFLVIDPIGGRPELLDELPANPLMHQQIGWMRADASVETAATPAANSVNLLVETVILNYMALHGTDTDFDQAGYFPRQSLGESVEDRKRFVAFKPLGSVRSGFISPPSG